MVIVNTSILRQFYPQRKKLHVTIVDTGNTIVSNVANFFKSPTMKSSECIDWAMISRKHN